MSIVTYVFSRSFPPQIQGLREWGVTMLAVGFAFLFFMLRGFPNSYGFLSYYLSNVLVIMGISFGTTAFARFYKTIFHVKWIFIAFTLSTVLLTIEYFLTGNQTTALRTLIVNTSGTLAFVYMATTVFRHRKTQSRLSTFLAAGPPFLLCIILSIRTLKIFIGQASSVEMHAKSGTQFLFFSSAGTMTVIFSLGFIFLAIERRTQETLEQTAKAQHASRLTSLGEIAGGIAHEINNPLAIILGCIQQLQRALPKEIAQNEKISGLLRRTISSVERITKIIKGLRTFTKQSDMDELHPENVSQIIRDTLDFCSEKFHTNGVRITTTILQDAKISCRSVQISQILINLLNNAYDAILEAAPEQKEIMIQTQVQDQSALISVSNTGLPIPKNIQTKLFQPFFTTKEIGKGTGLGLSVSKNIAEQHGGDLYFDQEQKLTTFMIKLPIIS